MPTTANVASSKADETMDVEQKSGVNSLKTTTEENVLSETKISDNNAEAEKLETEKGTIAPEGKEDQEKKQMNEEMKEMLSRVEIEPKTGVSFPSMLEDGKQLTTFGVRKKSMLGLGIKIYAFGMYAENEKLKDLVTKNIGKPPAKPTKEMFQMVIDSDVAMMVRLVIVYSGLTMSTVRKSFDEGLGAAIKKLTGGKNDELTKKVMGETSDDIKLTPGSVIEISRLPGYILQAKVMGEVVSNVNSELLCRAYTYLYLGEDPFDKEAREKFGTTLISLF